MTSKGIISVFAFRQGGKSRKKGLGKDKRARCDTMEPKVPSDARHNPGKKMWLVRNRTQHTNNLK